MSLYCGFSSSKEESLYIRNIAHLLQLLQTHLLKYIRAEPLDISYWSRSFAKVYQSVLRLEENKQTHPKLSVYCSQIAELYAPPSNRSKVSTTLKHDHDLTFIQESVSFPSLSQYKTRRSQSQIRIHEKYNVPPLKTRIQHRDSTPFPKRFKPLPISKRVHNNYRKQKRREPRDIYQDRAMWNLHNNIMTYT